MPPQLDIPAFPQRVQVPRLKWHAQPLLQLYERALRFPDEMQVSEETPLDHIDTHGGIEDVEGGWRQITPHLWQADTRCDDGQRACDAWQLDRWYRLRVSVQECGVHDALREAPMAVMS